jgi:thioredoxin 1
MAIMEKRMKSLILTSVLILALAGCSGRNDEPSGKEQIKADTTAAAVKADSMLVTFIELGSVNCTPCKMMQPVMEALKKEFAGQVKVVFHDVWTKEGEPYAVKWRIRAIPTQIFLDKEGKEFFRHTGYFPREEIIKVLKSRGVE